MESRDTRGERNKKQGMLNYNLKFKTSNEEDDQQKKAEKEADIRKINDIVFRGKPKRVFKSNKNRDIAFSDPKRVHTALRVRFQLVNSYRNLTICQLTKYSKLLSARSLNSRTMRKQRLSKLEAAKLQFQDQLKLLKISRLYLTIYKKQHKRK